MKITLVSALCGVLLAAGCQPPSRPAPGGQGNLATRPAASPDPVVARIDDRTITERQLVDPLIESHGLVMLMQLSRLELAKMDAARKGIIIRRDDIRSERTRELNRMFKDGHIDQIEEMEKAADAGDQAKADDIRRQIEEENEKFLDQWLAAKNTGRAEFEIALEIRAYLVKLAEPELRDKLTEDNVRTAWKARYGENVIVQLIEAATMQKILDARRRLTTEPFEKVARELSENRSAALDGELPPFSREATRYPEAMKKAAFETRVGDVSDIVQADGKYLLIKVKQKIEPKAVAFDSVKDNLRKELLEAWINETVAAMQQVLTQKVIKEIQIVDPVLRRQFQQRIDQRDSEIRDSEAIQRELDKQRAALATRTTTMPMTMPATLPTTMP